MMINKIQTQETGEDTTTRYITLTKWSRDTVKYIYVISATLQGITHALQCPYCRKFEDPPIYNFSKMHEFFPSRTTEWNVLERKLKTRSCFTMRKEGSTFAFKISNYAPVLHIMWTEVESEPVIYLYPIPPYEPTLLDLTGLKRTVKKYLYKRIEKKMKNPYKQPKRYKMIR